MNREEAAKHVIQKKDRAIGSVINFVSFILTLGLLHLITIIFLSLTPGAFFRKFVYVDTQSIEIKSRKGMLKYSGWVFLFLILIIITFTFSFWLDLRHIKRRGGSYAEIKSHIRKFPESFDYKSIPTNDKQFGNKGLEKIISLIGDIGKPINAALPGIELKGYTKRFGSFLATKDVSFSVGHGVIHGFIGPNGSGKTTTIKAMIGAYIPTRGKVLINGFKAGSSNANSLIGYIPERASFPKHLNAIQYLTTMGELSGLESKTAKSHGYKILSALGLQAHAKRKPNGFSSGMQKKILLAQALLADPKILILDEPAANLDPSARKELFDQLIFLRDKGKTILISSHILSDLERIIDEVTFLYFGEIIYTGSINEFDNRTSNVFLKSVDNIKLAKFLESKKYKLSGDIKTEVVIHALEPKKIGKLMKHIQESQVRLKSFRANDLQSVYDKLIYDAQRKNRGKQSISGFKTIAMISKKNVRTKKATYKQHDSFKGGK